VALQYFVLQKLMEWSFWVNQKGSAQSSSGISLDDGASVAIVVLIMAIAFSLSYLSVR
jgi:uncharacterized ion transporter superfamily protein YfcC